MVAAGVRPPLSWTVLALAAALGLTVLGLVFVLRQGQLQRQADREALAAAQREAAELRAQLETARKGSQGGTPTSGDGSQGQLAETPAPGIPTPKGSLPPVNAPPVLANRPPGEGSTVPRAAAALAVTFGPWLTVRGTSASNPFRLEAGGAATPVTPDEDGRIVIGFDLGPALEKTNVRLEILDAGGKTLWSGEKLSAVLQGDKGTAAALKGLKPGRYRLRAQAVDGGSSRGEASPEYWFEVGGSAP